MCPTLGHLRRHSSDTASTVGSGFSCSVMLGFSPRRLTHWSNSDGKKDVTLVRSSQAGSCCSTLLLLSTAKWPRATSLGKPTERTGRDSHRLGTGRGRISHSRAESSLPPFDSCPAVNFCYVWWHPGSPPAPISGQLGQESWYKEPLVKDHGWESAPGSYIWNWPFALSGLGLESTFCKIEHSLL